MEDQEEDEDSVTKVNSPPKNYKNKDITEIIMESQKKVIEKMKNQSTSQKGF